MEELAKLLAQQRRQARPEDYVYDKAQEAYWDLRVGKLYGPKAVDASIPRTLWRVEVEEGDPEPPEGQSRRRGRPRNRRERLIAPSADICRVENDQFVEGSTWWPGKPQIIRDVIMRDSGPEPSLGARLFNTYRPPEPLPLDAGHEPPTLWFELVEHLFPDAENRMVFFDYCAHVVQRPGEKANFGVALIGEQGIGKDALLLPLIKAVGAANSKVVDPDVLFDRFGNCGETLVLIVNEVRPQHQDHRYPLLYEGLKPLTATPPETLRADRKFHDPYYVMNLVRVFLITNHRDVLFMPEDDRRLFILESRAPKNWHCDMGRPDFFERYFAWLREGGGNQSVRWWLMTRDIGAFKPHGHAPISRAKQRLQQSWNAPEGPLDDALERLGRPEIVFAAQLLAPAFDHKEELEKILGTRRIDHVARRSGYEVVRPQPPLTGFRFKPKGGPELRARNALVRKDLMSMPPEALEDRILAALAASAVGGAAGQLKEVGR